MPTVPRQAEVGTLYASTSPRARLATAASAGPARSRRRQRPSIVQIRAVELEGLGFAYGSQNPRSSRLGSRIEAAT